MTNKDIIEELMILHKDCESDPPTTVIMSEKEEFVLSAYIKALKEMSNRDVIREVDLRSNDGTDQETWYVFKIRIKEAAENELDKRMKHAQNEWIQELMGMTNEELIEEFKGSIEDLPGSGARGRHRYANVHDELLRRMKRSKNGIIAHVDENKI